MFTAEKIVVDRRALDIWFLQLRAVQQSEEPEPEPEDVAGGRRMDPRVRAFLHHGVHLRQSPGVRQHHHQLPASVWVRWAGPGLGVPCRSWRGSGGQGELRSARAGKASFNDIRAMGGGESCWLVGCLTSQQRASVSQGRIYSDVLPH